VGSVLSENPLTRHMATHTDNDNSVAPFTVEDVQSDDKEASLINDESSESVTNGNGNNVGFSTVHVHSHRLTLGDHPDVSSGIPLQLGWDVQDSEEFDLDTFEQGNDHKLSRISRRSREEIAMLHHSRESVVIAHNEVQEIKHSRIDNERDRSVIASAVASMKNRRMSAQTVPKPKPKRPLFSKWFQRS
jgi:hypothetical protein